MYIPPNILAAIAAAKSRQNRDVADQAQEPNAASSSAPSCFDSYCVRCNKLVKPGHVCRPSAPASKPRPASSPSPSPSPSPAPNIDHLAAARKRSALIAKGLERKPWLTLRDVQRKLPDATWDDFAAARSGLVERYRKDAWRIMDTLQAGAPLPANLRRLCEQIVATYHGRTFESCGQYLIRSALKPKLATAYLTDSACPWDNSAKKA